MGKESGRRGIGTINHCTHGRTPSSKKVPDWPEDRFDMVWVFDRVDAHWHLTQVRQLFLAGDRAEPFT